MWSKSDLNSPVQLLERNGDLEVVSQHVERCEDVGPLYHLAQRTPLQHFGTEHVPRLLRQEAHVNQNLDAERRGIKSRRQESAAHASVCVAERIRVCLVVTLLCSLPWLLSLSSSRRAAEAHCAAILRMRLFMKLSDSFPVPTCSSRAPTSDWKTAWMRGGVNNHWREPEVSRPSDVSFTRAAA
ncbi:hypothetical protein EYF80_006328 [Liparis tanakae]|uniref:Uncharacterized protein n=1 Tax=Liparis tanakae TaxID=230148 RepID=A0A4Z2J014_9TELE|nr:hypothetical protein EYF80_006328 [Liparis tanakae]